MLTSLCHQSPSGSRFHIMLTPSQSCRWPKTDITPSWLWSKIRISLHELKNGSAVYEHVIQVVIDPPLIHFVAVLCRHIDREWIAQTIRSRIWTWVRAAFARVCTTGDLGTPVWFSRSVRRITFFTVLYCSLGIAWLLATRSNQFETLV